MCGDFAVMRIIIKGETFYLFNYSGARLGPFMRPDASIVCMMTRVHYIASDIVLTSFRGTYLLAEVDSSHIPYR